MSERDDATQQRSHSLAINAKLLCSGIFVAGRSADDLLANDLPFDTWPERFSFSEISIAIDQARQTVTLADGSGLRRTAVHHPGYGCTIIPEQMHGVAFNPPTLDPAPDDPRPWPLGNGGGADTAVGDRAALDAALDQAFDDSRWPAPARTRAVVAVHGGRLVAERYAPGFSAATRQINWSMGKSLTAALVGMLVGDGALELDAPAPVAEWHGAGDPRREITLRHLLQMRSGLEYRRLEPQDPAFYTPDNHHLQVYFGAIDVFAQSIGRPLEFPPGSHGRYRNCDPLTLGAIVRRTVEARGEDYLTFPHRRLFAPIGMHAQVLEPDPWGNFIMTGFEYGIARDWARFGLLHLRDGDWFGTQVLPRGWAAVVSSPSPASGELARGEYGGLFWLNRSGRLPNVPEDAYWAAGAMGQVTMVIPSRDAVIVRLGHTSDA
ncbi:MAG: serine hydrolase, partial [Chloroflexi bacterium]